MGVVGRHKPRVGLLMEGMTIPAWTAAMLRQIRESECATIALVVLREGRGRRGGRLARLVRGRQTLLYRSYRAIERRRNTPSPDGFAPVDVAGLLTGIPTVRIPLSLSAIGANRAGAEALATIARYELDILLQIGSRSPEDEILTAARLGVWVQRLTDPGSPDGVWETLSGAPVVGTTLRMLHSNLPGGAVLDESYSATDPLAIGHTRNTIAWKAVGVIPRKLRELHESGARQFLVRARAAASTATPSCATTRLPSNREFVLLITRHLMRYIRGRAPNLLFVTQWILLFDLSDERSMTYWRFRKIIPPRDRFWADPFVVWKDGHYYIFVEEFPYKTARGRIAVLTLDERGRYGAPRVVLERPYHLSYPFVFEWEGEHYMIPESAESQTVDVYKCAEFPDRWEYHTTLLAGVAALDATLFHHGGRWWLFANVIEHAGASGWDELCLFSADNPLSTNWRPHPQNPIVSDVRRARPAGRIFACGGNIYRPSQDSSRGYGYAIRMNQIIRLSETEYEEREISRIEPGWDRAIKGVHTLDHRHRLTIIDARIRRPKYW